MGTAAWGGRGEGKCFRCNGLSWCGCHLQCPSLLHQTAAPPKLLGVLIIRLWGRTAQPSATPASPPVSIRGMINPALHSASPKETSRWCVATQPRVDPAMQMDLLGQNGVRGVLAASPVEKEASRPGRGTVLWGFYPP